MKPLKIDSHIPLPKDQRSTRPYELPRMPSGRDTGNPESPSGSVLSSFLYPKNQGWHRQAKKGDRG